MLPGLTRERVAGATVELRPRFVCPGLVWGRLSSNVRDEEPPRWRTRICGLVEPVAAPLGVVLALAARRPPNCRQAGVPEIAPVRVPPTRLRVVAVGLPEDPPRVGAREELPRCVPAAVPVAVPVPVPRDAARARGKPWNRPSLEDPVVAERVRLPLEPVCAAVAPTCVPAVRVPAARVPPAGVPTARPRAVAGCPVVAPDTLPRVAVDVVAVRAEPSADGVRTTDDDRVAEPVRARPAVPVAPRPAAPTPAVPVPRPVTAALVPPPVPRLRVPANSRTEPATRSCCCWNDARCAVARPRFVVKKRVPEFEFAEARRKSVGDALRPRLSAEGTIGNRPRIRPAWRNCDGRRLCGVPTRPLANASPRIADTPLRCRALR